MKKLVSFVVFILLGICLSASVPETQSILSNYPIAVSELSCDLPAPDNLTVTGTTSNSVSLSWDPVPGAVDYWVDVTEMPSGNPVTAYSTTSTNTTITAAPGQTLQIRVSGGCGGGQYSPKYAEKISKIEFVIEIVNNGYQTTGQKIHVGAIQSSTSVAFNLRRDKAYAITAKVMDINTTEVFYVFCNPSQVNMLNIGKSCASSSSILGYCGLVGLGYTCAPPNHEHI